MMINVDNPTISTLSTDFIAASRGAQGWEDQAWPQSLEVPVTTLDALIGVHGVPSFIKLDIENAEAQALRGAHQTLATFHPRVAVALENAKVRLEYAAEVLEVVRDAYPGYTYECGVCTNPEPGRRVLPEILHLF